jgi:hypothetical protein
MSVQRQKTPTRLAPLYLAFALLVAALGWAPAHSLPSDSVVTDPQTGFAIDGFDPVAYFTGAGPTLGRAEFEYQLAGVTWRFHSEGNRDAFVDHPEVYAPQFGGYDPVAIARGISVAGHPMTWLVAGERLYLFYDAKARAEFIVAPQRAIESARRRWPDVRRTLP